jgi:hypothetical protein
MRGGGSSPWLARVEGLMQGLDMFQPTLLGTEFVDEDGRDGMVTDETEDSVYLESPLFTGWANKESFFALVEED